MRAPTSGEMLEIVKDFPPYICNKENFNFDDDFICKLEDHTMWFNFNCH